MKQKVIKCIVILFILPIIVSLCIAIFGGNKTTNNNSYDSISGEFHHDNLTYSEKVRSSNTFIYLSVFTLVVFASGVWVFVKKKGEV